jgi:hypothetical protein
MEIRKNPQVFERKKNADIQMSSMISKHKYLQCSFFLDAVVIVEVHNHMRDLLVQHRRDSRSSQQQLWKDRPQARRIRTQRASNGSRRLLRTKERRLPGVANRLHQLLNIAVVVDLATTDAATPGDFTTVHLVKNV